VSGQVLYEVRCPYKADRYGQSVVCNHLVLKVAAGSRGEAFCSYCKKRFDFEVGGNEPSRIMVSN
jgi:uncharacterized Zn-finger protein